ncbi:regulatory amdA [Fusarium tjaetaba]|uniref:Regulatory amdA n=1 Tax=Fusarium tjaetaba TaxID=1567544 RepID=A0A8H5RQF2_9HYPO|nr:regulatory amdA [Fusarium tjaetaba]KAF5639041.1 regulatory amdA [Fusarium tjaetaba]
MLAIQSMEGPPRPLPGPPPPLVGPEPTEVRQPKPKTLPCKYCSKRFRRVEHVQRHERTHTKEKPFSCGWDRCGKTFGRRDLLVRHEKLVHLNEGSKDNNRPRKLSSNTSSASHKSSISEGQISNEALGQQHLNVSRPPPPQQPLPQPQQFHHGPPPNTQQGPQDPRTQPRTAACNLDLLSDAALASSVTPVQRNVNAAPLPPHSPDSRRKSSYGESIVAYTTERPREDQPLGSGYVPQQLPTGSYDDYNPFLDELTSSSHFLPPNFEIEQQMMYSRNQGGPAGRRSSKSSFVPGRFPPMQTEARDPADPAARGIDEAARQSALRISVSDHTVIKNRLDEFSAVLPNDFVFPSRHTLTRFLEGYISGLHEHLPFLHLPTFSPAETAPELLLAILAVGAQYRFEKNRGYALWYAAKAVAMEQIRRRRISEVHALLPTASAYSPHSTRPSPSATYRHSFASAQSERPTTQDTHREPYSPNTPQARIETIQAVLLLFAVGLWGVPTILHEALSLQSNLAILIREEGLVAEVNQSAVNDWETWIRLETATRTKLVAYCFFNLCSIAYNMPPLLLTSELNLLLPQRGKLWRAETAWQWQEMRQSTPMMELTLHDAFSRLFGRTNQGLPQHLSSLGSYVLIHALIQHIYLLKQTSFATGLPYNIHRTMKPEDVEEVTQALRVWQTSFEDQHQLRAAEAGHYNALDSNVGGTLDYTATALLRQAYIRLYTDVTPSTALETRDPLLVASALSRTPLLVRSLRLHRAVFQAFHALSMLVKAGVNYVARTKSADWSIQHSLCNFECAILVSKWLLTIAAIGPHEAPASPEEKSLLDNVGRMLDETEFAVPPIDPSLSGQNEVPSSDSAKLRQLAVAVVRLWAETFKGTHIFEIVKVMGQSLDKYAELIEKPRDRSPPVRLLEPNMN